MPKKFAIGIDLGGTNIRTALITKSGNIRAFHQQPTRAELKIERIMENIASAIFHLCEVGKVRKDAIVGVGLGAPGFLSHKAGTILFSPNLPGARETPIVKHLKKITGFPIVLENDANTAAIGEHWQGAGRGSNNLLTITLGTGVGSGFILNGRIWHGSDGLAGELGHTTLIPDGLPCKCGRKGCLEAYVSATGIVTRTLQALKQRRQSSLASYIKKGSEPLTSLTIYHHAKMGDRLAQEIFEETGRYLAISLANVLNILDLEMIIIGGQVSRAGELLLRPILKEVKRRAIRAPYYPIHIVRSKLGNYAGIMGAAKMVFDHAGSLGP